MLLVRANMATWACHRLLSKGDLALVEEEDKRVKAAIEQGILDPIKKDADESDLLKARVSDADEVEGKSMDKPPMDKALRHGFGKGKVLRK